MTVYVSDLFTATPAPVNATPASTRTWQWLRGSSAISGATSSTYTAVTADIGSTLSATQLETNFLATTTATSAATEVVQAFDPIRLFSASEPGVWYDPSDMSTLYQDFKGSIPVTSFGQPVGLMLDKSRGGIGPETVVNGDFATDAVWAKSGGWAISGGVAANNGTNDFSLTQNIGVVFGRTYRVTFTVTSYTSGLVSVSIGSTRAPNRLIATAAGTYTALMAASGTSGQVGFYPEGTFIGSIDNISVKELPGLHATQSTEASRPLYGIVPVSGRRNLLTQTEAFENAVWTKTNATVTANATVAPDGTTTGDKVIEDTTNGVHRVTTTLTFTGPQTHTFTCYLKAAERSFGYLSMGVAAFGGEKFAYFDLATGTVGTTAASTTVSIEPVGNGWYRCSITATSISGGITAGYNISAALADNVVSYAGTTGSGVLIWGAQLEQSSTPTAYQRVSTDLDVTEAGVASVGYLRFDGSTSFMVTPTITPGTDKVQVFAGVRRITDTIGVIAEFSPDINTNAGSFLFLTGTAITTGLGPGFNFTSRGAAALSVTQVGVSPTTFAPPVTAVIAASGNISGDTSSVRGNGVAGVNGTGDQGTGNYLAYPMYIGRRGGSTSTLNGHLFPLIVRFGPTLTAARIAATEAWVATKTGGVTL